VDHEGRRLLQRVQHATEGLTPVPPATWDDRPLTEPLLVEAYIRSTTFYDDQGLTQRMSVPRGTRARLERNASTNGAGRIVCLKERVNTDGASKPLGRSPTRRLRTNSFDFHLSRSFVFCVSHARGANAKHGTLGWRDALSTR